MKKKCSPVLYMQGAKFSFMVKNFYKWREVMELNFFNLVLKGYWKSMDIDFFKCLGTLSIIASIL